MALLLSIVASVAAGCALLVAWRAARAAHRLALEMVQLRDRLAAAEAHYDGAAHAAARAAAAPAPPDPGLASRISTLEARLRAAQVQAMRTGPGPAAEDNGTRVRRYMLRQGFSHVTILDEDDDGRLLVEAEREGVTSKGRAHIDADGSVHWQPVSTLRAFP